jgi:iron complex transport system ATP-binding protein
VNNLEFGYKKHKVFQGISLDLYRGQVLSLVGPNGAGKTTLLKCIDHLLVPGGGEIIIEGRNITSLSRLELARSIAYVPQASPSQFPITVFDAVMLGRKPYLNWKPGKKDIAMVMDMINRLELSDMVMRDLNELSGGERQKVIIAKAIVQEPKILLFDEPTTYLDLKYQLKIMQFIRELIDEKQICAMVTTHDLNLALMYSDRIAVLKNGKIVAEGNTGILTEEVILDVYGVQASLHYEQMENPFMVPLRAVE